MPFILLIKAVKLAHVMSRVTPTPPELSAAEKLMPGENQTKPTTTKPTNTGQGDGGRPRAGKGAGLFCMAMAGTHQLGK